MIRPYLSSVLALLAVPAFAQDGASSPAATPATAPADREAVIGVLDKRLTTSQEFTLKPGERFTFGTLNGILHTCEQTEPYERPQSAAFVQVTETPRPRTRDEKVQPRTVFSGWLFAESPSLNPMRHPVYDVWLKSCTINRPEGPSRSEAGRDTKASGASPNGTVRSTETSGGAESAGASD